MKHLCKETKWKWFPILLMLAYETLIFFEKPQLKYIIYRQTEDTSAQQRYRNRNTLLLATEFIQKTTSTAHLQRFPDRSLSRIIILNYK